MLTTVLLTIVILTGTAGELAATHAMKQIGEVHHFSPRAILGFLHRALRMGWMWIALALMTVSFFAMLAVLSSVDLSFAIPATALSYAVGALGARFVLRERVSAARWAGVSLVCAGVGLVCLGQSSLTDKISRMGTLGEISTASVFRALILLGAALPLLYYGIAIVSAWRFFRRRTEAAEGFTPPASILKPVHGLDREAYENFSSFCRQDYPDYEVLFCVSEQEDPAIPVIQKLIQDFPQRSIRLLVGAERLGANNKANKLCRLVREARHDLLVISDSDVRVDASYLRVVAAPFQDPRVGAVTCLFRGNTSRQLGSELDSVGSSSDFNAGAVVAWQLQEVEFALGSTMATSRDRLREIGGFEALVDHHSDDYELGNRISARGYRVELLPEPVWMIFPSQSLADLFRHELRWAIGLRHIRPWGHAGLLLTFGLPWSLAAALVAPVATWKAACLAAYIGLRLSMAWMVGVWGLRDPLLGRRLWLIPLHDAQAFVIWLLSLFWNRIRWRGKEFYLRNGRLVPILMDRGTGL